MTKIGKGQFSTAYRLKSGRVLIKSRDPVKECMALGWFPKHRMFPRIERIDADNIDLRDGEQAYEMAYFDRPKSLKNSLSSRQYRLYKALRKLSVFCRLDDYDRPNKWRAQFESLPCEFRAEKEALCEAVDALCNYGYQIGFEISPRNVAVKGSKLILLDCFFMVDMLVDMLK